jgi:hypothetical protein
MTATLIDKIAFRAIYDLDHASLKPYVVNMFSSIRSTHHVLRLLAPMLLFAEHQYPCYHVLNSMYGLQVLMAIISFITSMTARQEKSVVVNGIWITRLDHEQI